MLALKRERQGEESGEEQAKKKKGNPSAASVQTSESLRLIDGVLYQQLVEMQEEIASVNMNIVSEYDRELHIDLLDKRDAMEEDMRPMLVSIVRKGCENLIVQLQKEFPQRHPVSLHEVAQERDYE